jgi:hypothetical protein
MKGPRVAPTVADVPSRLRRCGASEEAAVIVIAEHRSAGDLRLVDPVAAGRSVDPLRSRAADRVRSR